MGFSSLVIVQWLDLVNNVINFHVPQKAKTSRTAAFVLRDNEKADEMCARTVTVS